MANSIPNINPNSIQVITGLGHKPIYFVTLNPGNTTLVIKGEQFVATSATSDNEDALISIAWSSKIMKNISQDNREVNSKIMTPLEINEFKRAARVAFPQGSNQEFHLNAQYNWVKMPKVNHLSDMDYMKMNGNFSTEDFKKIKKNITVFLEPTHWVNLGKVVAADLFNGNNDRFTKDGEWANKGNVMFTNGTVIGMDTWDPMGTNGGGLESNLGRGGGDYSSLRPLIDANARRTYAEAVARSVGHEFANAMRIGKMTKLSFMKPDGNVGSVTQEQMKVLFADFADEFEQGIAAGAQTMKNYLQQKVRDYQQKQNQFANRNNYQQPQQPPQQRFGGMGGHRGGQQAPQQNGFQRGNVPNRPQQQHPGMMGNNHRAQTAQPHKGSVIPQGILDRMASLGW